MQDFVIAAVICMVVAQEVVEKEDLEQDDTRTVEGFMGTKEFRVRLFKKDSQARILTV